MADEARVAADDAVADAGAVAGTAGITDHAPTVLILADDLIWATRLADAVTAAGGRVERRRRLDDLAAGHGTFVIVDLTARAYDGVAAVATAAATGARVVAVGQHDDAALRKAALDAGAEKVFTYRALFEDGPRVLGRWLGR